AAVAAGNPARGIQLWEQLVSLAPTSPEAAVASVRMEQVRRDGSSRSEAAWANAQKAIIAGDFVAARAQLKEVLRLDPLHKDAQATLDGVNTKLRADAEAAYKEARRLEDIEDRRGAVSGYRRVMTLVGDRNDALYKRAETRLADLN
ncbi:MAG TPA: hypothetical protein PKW90_22970, partial [Myxococcota bacterium]|nr:hypothetical protein [Myxococcota bacterium]